MLSSPGNPAERALLIKTKKIKEEGNLTIPIILQNGMQFSSTSTSSSTSYYKCHVCVRNETMRHHTHQIRVRDGKGGPALFTDGENRR